MSLTRIRTALRGVSGVHVTPYAADGSIDEALARGIVARIAAAGVHNIVSGGNTGEFYTMTTAETERLHALAIEANAGRAVLTAAVGRSLRDAIATAATAAAAGADAVMVHHPLDPFAAPQSQADYFLAVAEASTLPVVAYVRADTIPVAALVAVAAHPNIAGVKFASTNLMLLAECLRRAPADSAVWVCGLAEGWAAPFYAMGARGFTSGLVNVAPARSLAIHAALERGDFASARRDIDAIAAFEAMRALHNNGANVTVVKEALMLMGMPVGPVRPPGLVALDAQNRAALKVIVEAWK